MVRIELVLASAIVAGVVTSLAIVTISVPASTSSASTTSTSSSSSASSSSTSTSDTTSSTSGQDRGTANGTISIGPLRPVCLANSTVGPAPANIASIQAVIKSSSGNTTNVLLDWAVYSQCEARGQFQVALQAGSYTLDLSSCSFLGCKNSLPKAFVVYPNRVTIIDVSVDTGIR